MLTGSAAEERLGEVMEQFSTLPDDRSRGELLRTLLFNQPVVATRQPPDRWKIVNEAFTNLEHLRFGLRKDYHNLFQACETESDQHFWQSLP
jgi:hypothetical protein